MKTLLLVVLLLAAPAAAAAPLAQVDRDGTRIVLYDEPCALPAITNLLHRAEWTSKGKTYEGCWGLNVFDIVEMYFDDKTVISIPVRYFSRVQGA